MGTDTSLSTRGQPSKAKDNAQERHGGVGGDQYRWTEDVDYGALCW